MHRALALLLVLLVALQPDAVLAQASMSVSITIKSDGTCQTAGLHVPCLEIGPKLREAGIPPDTYIRFTGERNVSYDVIRATMDSVAQAGFGNTAIGFITRPAS